MEVGSQRRSRPDLLTLSYSHVDPSATWTAEIFQRKLSFEPPSDNCILLLLLWGEQCDGEISFKELPLFRQRGRLWLAHSNFLRSR